MSDKTSMYDMRHISNVRPISRKRELPQDAFIRLCVSDKVRRENDTLPFIRPAAFGGGFFRVIFRLSVAVILCAVLAAGLMLALSLGATG